MLVKPLSLRMLETLFTCEDASSDDAYARKVERPKVREARREDRKEPGKRPTRQS